MLNNHQRLLGLTQPWLNQWFRLYTTSPLRDPTRLLEAHPCSRARGFGRDTFVAGSSSSLEYRHASAWPIRYNYIIASARGSCSFLGVRSTAVTRASGAPPAAVGGAAFGPTSSDAVSEHGHGHHLFQTESETGAAVARSRAGFSRGGIMR